MLSETPDAIDTLQGRVPAVVKWIFAGMGAAAGYSYAQAHGALMQSAVVAGGAFGFVLVVLLFFGLRLLKLAVIAVAVLVVVNYAVLVPFGYGDHAVAWIAAGHSVAAAGLDALSRLAGRWQEGMGTN